MYSHVNITPVKGRRRGGVTVSRVQSETHRFSPSDWSIRRGVKQVTWWCVVIVLRGLFYPPDTLKPILFVQYGHSCIDLYLCGLNIKHNCVLKNTNKRLASYFAQWEDAVSWSVFPSAGLFAGQGGSSKQRRYEKAFMWNGTKHIDELKVHVVQL